MKYDIRSKHIFEQKDGIVVVVLNGDGHGACPSDQVVAKPKPDTPG